MMAGEKGVDPGGDAARAVSVLVGTHGPKLHAVAARLCGNRADAEDVVQDTFLQAFRKWRTFRGEADAGTWLYTIAARRCAAKHRAKKKARTLGSGAIERLMPWSETTVTSASMGDEDDGERRESVERVRGAIARLDTHLRQVVVFKEVLGLSVRDAAAVLGLAENTVKTRLHRARLALRKAMTDGAPSTPAPAPLYDRRVCLDLLQAKLDTMDRGVPLRVAKAEVCARCRAVFKELDLVRDACAEIGEAASLPARMRARIERALHEAAAPTKAKRGRRPVRAGR